MTGTIESQLRYHAKHPDTPELARHWMLKAVDELKYRSEVIEQRNTELSRGRDDFMQALTDPENQPSQWGTVTLEMYEKLEAENADLKDRWYKVCANAFRNELEELKRSVNK